VRSSAARYSPHGWEIRGQLRGPLALARRAVGLTAGRPTVAPPAIRRRAASRHLPAERRVPGPPRDAPARRFRSPKPSSHADQPQRPRPGGGHGVTRAAATAAPAEVSRLLGLVLAAGAAAARGRWPTRRRRAPTSRRPGPAIGAGRGAAVSPPTPRPTGPRRSPPWPWPSRYVQAVHWGAPDRPGVAHLPHCGLLRRPRRRPPALDVLGRLRQEHLR